MTTRTRRDRAKPMPVDERRDAIVAALVPLLRTHGGDVTTRQIAEAAGIAEGTIFRVFPDKRALYWAAAERTISPPGWQQEMEERLDALPTLHAKVLAVIDGMVSRMQEVMTVMVALRGLLMSEGPPKHSPEDPPGPPAFIVEAGRQLHAALATLVFAPHREELRVSPEVAATALRSLVMGGWHPGAGATDRLEADEVADIILDGVRRSR